MRSLILSRSTRTMWTIGALIVLGLGARAQAEPPPACHEIEIVYEGREFVYSIDDVDYYRWTYTVIGDSCISLALSHWTLEFCIDFLDDISEVSTLSIDQSDPADGDTSAYVYEIGYDPTTGLLGLKWELGWGNELDKEGELDTFSFVSPGEENPQYPVMWVSKGGRLFDGGNVIGPGCFPPVPTERVTWGAIKAKMR